MVKDELFTSQSELRGSREELRAARDELRNKIALLDGARRKASEAVGSIELLTQTPLLKPTPLLHPLLHPLMSDLPHISSIACFFFFFVGLGTQDICRFFLNEYSFFISPLSPLLALIALFCIN